MEKVNFKQWAGFKKGDWCDKVNVRDFIQKNYTPYTNTFSIIPGALGKDSLGMIHGDVSCASIQGCGCNTMPIEIKESKKQKQLLLKLKLARKNLN